MTINIDLTALKIKTRTANRRLAKSVIEKTVAYQDVLF